MNRLALLAVLAAAVGFNAPTTCRAQTVHGHSKFTMKDPTLRAPSASAESDSEQGGSEAAYAGVGQQQVPYNMAAYGRGAASYPPAAYAQGGMPSGAMPPGAMPPGYMPYMPSGYAGQHPGMQVSYPGYAPTAENMLYGGSPYPQVMPAGYGAAGGPPGQGYAGDASCGPDGCGPGGGGVGHGGRCRPHHWIFGYDATADWIGSGCSHMYVVAEGLKFFPKGANAPALLSTSPIGTPQAQAGVLGQPGTQVLVGGSEFDDEALYGGRIAMGFWTMGAEYVGFEFNYMGFDNGGTTINAESSFNPENGGGILALPFFNVTTGAEDSLILAFPDFQAVGGIIDTGGVPIDLNGTFNLDSDLEIHSAGALMKSVVWVLPDAGWRMYFLGGYRFFWLSDDLDMTSTITPVGGAFGGSRLEIFDSFDTENQFHGGEIGLQTELASGPWSVGIITKVALGNNHQKVDIEGETRAVGGGLVIPSAGGLFAQPTNIGRSTDDVFAVLPEASVTLGYQLFRNVKLTAGYNFLYLNHVLRGAEQIDRSINTTQFDGGALVGDARPARAMNETEFWMHGFSTGVEVKW
jgi:hypothetical protein